MLLHELASELLFDIYRSCTSISDVVNLSFTCRRLHALLPSSRKLSVFFSAAEAEFGPVHDIIQLITLNNSQSAHSIRSPPLSYSLLRQVTSVGRVAQKWEAIYPRKKWNDGTNYAERRLLSVDERYRLRRAVYRYWLYAQAFHNRMYPRIMRLHHAAITERSELLHNWSTPELAEIEDFRDILRSVVSTQICPSDSHVQRKLRRYFPVVRDRTSFPNICHDQHLLPDPVKQLFHSSRDSAPPLCDDTTAAKQMQMFRSSPLETSDGWGDEIVHYYVVADMMKLDPAEVLWLRVNAPFKWQVEAYLGSLGDWFSNNGETFGQTFELVVQARGEDVEEIRDEIEDGRTGVAVSGRR